MNQRRTRFWLEAIDLLLLSGIVVLVGASVLALWLFPACWAGTFGI